MLSDQLVPSTNHTHARNTHVGPNEYWRRTLKDLAIELENRPGALAEMGEALGAAGVSVEGGGAFRFGDSAVGHFLVHDAEAARDALGRVGIRVLDVRDVVAVRLDQDTPGQLGAFTRRLAEADVNIEVLYSDHDHQLIVVVDDPDRAAVVARKWTQSRH